MKLAAFFTVFLVVLALSAVAPACTDTAAQYPCTGIPAGGCPLSMGLACDDPTCEAAYACNPGNVWTLDHVCPAHEAGADVAVPVDAAVEASPIVDASIDAPAGAYGGPGCEPLEAPDCSAGFALACPAASTCCDCQDLYVCQNGGWTLWGSCSVDAGVTPNP